MFNYLLGQLGMGTTITRNKTKRNGLFLFTLKRLYGSVSFIEGTTITRKETKPEKETNSKNGNAM
jgi:hypothetical protein